MVRKWVQSIFGRSKVPYRAEIDGSVIELQQERSRAAVVHYQEKGSRLSFHAEWDSNKDNMACLFVTLPESVSLAGITLADPGTILVAGRISRGLLEMGIKYSQIIQSLPSIPIPTEECEAGLAKVQERLAAQGWRVTYDKPAGTMKWDRVPGAEAKSTAVDAGELAELTLSATQWVRGSSSRHRTLIQTPGSHRE